MRIILGIGNPGKKYLYTRHNAGFLLLDYFAEKNNLAFKASKHDYYYSEGKTGTSGFSLIKPTTYVNNSGVAVTQAFEEYNSSISDLLVIADDINLPAGQLRVRASGGDGGHNGLKSLIYHLNSNQFARIRIGIGSSSDNRDMVDFVLSRFSDEEFEMLKATFKDAVILMDSFIDGGLKSMMDTNSKMQKKVKDSDNNKNNEDLSDKSD